MRSFRIGFGLLLCLTGSFLHALEVGQYGYLGADLGLFYEDGESESRSVLLSSTRPVTEAIRGLRHRGDAWFHWSRRIEKLDLSVSDSLSFRLNDDFDLSRRYESLDNDLRVDGLLHWMGPAFLRGQLSWQTHDDRRYKEFAYQDQGASLAFERHLDPYRRLAVGYARHNIEFQHAPLEDYETRDLFVSFYRVAPPVYRTKMVMPSGFGRVFMGRHFNERERELMKENLYPHAAKVADVPQRGEPYPVIERAKSEMFFDAEYRMRETDILASQDRDYLENTFSARTLFVLNEAHSVGVSGRYSVREFERESLVDEILDFERGSGGLSWNLMVGDLMFGQELEYQKTFYERDSSRDYGRLSYAGSLDWNMDTDWHAMFWYQHEKTRYDSSRQLYSDMDYSIWVLSATWDFRRRFSLTTTLERESREVLAFENAIDSSFDMEGIDWMVEYDLSRHISLNAGYRVEEERHPNFAVNDRNERLTYVGTRLRL